MKYPQCLVEFHAREPIKWNQEAINKGGQPSYIVESLDAVRNKGNFAAHPIKSKSTGEIVPVETGEAKWNPDVRESLSDFYFVRPKIIKQKKMHET